MFRGTFEIQFFFAVEIATKDSEIFFNQWRGAEAYHYFMLSQEQLYNGKLHDSLCTVYKLQDYDDFIGLSEVYSLYALVSCLNRAFGLCSRAFIKLKKGDNTVSIENINLSFRFSISTAKERYECRFQFEFNMEYYQRIQYEYNFSLIIYRVTRNEFKQIYKFYYSYFWNSPSFQKIKWINFFIFTDDQDRMSGIRQTVLGNFSEERSFGLEGSKSGLFQMLNSDTLLVTKNRIFSSIFYFNIWILGARFVRDARKSSPLASPLGNP